MKIFLAGATGALGRHLVPLLVAEVVAMTRSAGKAESLRSAGVDIGTGADPRRREGEARARLAAALPELARGLPPRPRARKDVRDTKDRKDIHEIGDDSSLVSFVPPTSLFRLRSLT